jgi:S-formylglutathione hydrolase
METTKPIIARTHKTFDGLTQFWSHFSNETNCQMNFSTFLPPKKPKGCLIYLSGLTCTEENFIMKAGAQKFLAEHQLMVIAPDTSPRGLNLPGDKKSTQFGEGAGFYVDSTTEFYRDHYRMRSYIVKDIYQIVQNHFKVHNISLFGHSMGGHGALTIGLTFPEKFKSVSALAPLSNPTKVGWGVQALNGYLGDHPTEWKKYDACELLDAGFKHPSPLLIHQGTIDEYLTKSLLPENLIAACERNRQPFEMVWCENYDHSYYFVSTFIEEHIKYHAKFLV